MELFDIVSGRLVFGSVSALVLARTSLLFPALRPTGRSRSVPRIARRVAAHGRRLARGRVVNVDVCKIW